MGPERTSSSVGALIAQLCKSEKLPEPWKPADVVSLISAYRGLVETIGSTERDLPSPEFEDDAMLNGRSGAYEDMVSRLKRLETKGKGKGKGLWNNSKQKRHTWISGASPSIHLSARVP